MALEVRDIVKRYPEAKVNAVDHLSFTAQIGECLGLLGENASLLCYRYLERAGD